MAAQGLADALGAQCSAAQGEHAHVVALEQLEHQALLGLAEGDLAVAIEPALDRLAQLALELVVGVERLHAQLGRDGSGRRRLPRTHEAREHERRL